MQKQIDKNIKDFLKQEESEKLQNIHAEPGKLEPSSKDQGAAQKSVKTSDSALYKLKLKPSVENQVVAQESQVSE